MMSDNSRHPPSSRRRVASATHSRGNGSGCEGISIKDVRGSGRLNFRDQISVSTWNCGGLSFTVRETLKDFYDILVLTETHDNGSLKSNKNFIKGEPAPSTDPYAGVSFLLSNRASKCVTHSGSCGPRITFIRVRSSPCDMFIVGVYIPHQHRLERPFYSDTLKQLKSVLDKAQQHDCVILLGDFNSKLCRNVEKLTGKWCVHNSPNKSGKEVLELLRQSKLTAISTFFQPPRGKNNSTYLAKDPQYKPSQIDYIMISCRWASLVKDCKVRWGISINRWGRHYDHGAILCTIKAKVKCEQNLKSKPRDFQTLKLSSEVRKNYEQFICKQINSHKFDKTNPTGHRLYLKPSKYPY